MEKLATLSDPVSRGHATDDALETRELIRQALAALESLEPDDRSLLRSLFIDCRNFAELANELGLTVSALYYRRARALERLGKLLE